MADNDFDLESLAVFLHLTPGQVEKMASRGKVPGRRIGGVWKFSRAEIHLWFEERIGIADESDLADYQQLLRSPSSEDELTLAELLPIQNLVFPLDGRTRNSVIEKICHHAGDLGLLWDPVKFAEAIRARENLHTTALENGVALLHPRRPLPNLMGEPFLILGRTFSGIPFGGLRGSLTDLFFLIGSVDDAVHLRTLTRLSRLIALPETLDKIREADSLEGIRQQLVEQEQKLLANE